MKLHISETLSLPRDTVTSTILVLGGKGMGKTNLAAVVIEELDRLRLRWSVADPVGVWWGLRHSKDGSGPGVECLILGGAHGDIPIEPTGGDVVADLVVDENCNVIIDFSRKADGEAWGVGEKIRFIRDYGKRLFQRQSSLVGGRRREPLFQMIDEAARFLPQMIRAGQPDLAMCLSVWSQIVEEGRNSGLGVGLVTQRSARLNKDVAELADAMFAFRTVGPNSVDAVMDWLGEHVPKAKTKEIVEQLRSLPVGHCLVVSPGWLQVEEIVRIRERETFDSSATPKPGESEKRVTGLAAKPDLKQYAARMAETIERAKDNDPKALKAKLRDTQERLEAAEEALLHPEDRLDQEAVDVAVARAVEAQQRRFRERLDEIKQYFGNKQYAVDKIVERLVELQEEIRKLAFYWPEHLGEVESLNYNLNPKLMPRIQTDPKMPPGTIELRSPLNTVRIENVGNGVVKIKAGARRMLAACATWHGKWISEAQVAAQACVKRTGGTFSTYKGMLTGNGLVQVQNGLWQIMPAGMKELGASTPRAPRTTQEVVDLWNPKLKKGAREMLAVLVKFKGRAITVGELGGMVSLASEGGTFSTYLGQLSTADLIVKPEKGWVAANKEVLFL